MYQLLLYCVLPLHLVQATTISPQSGSCPTGYHLQVGMKLSNYGGCAGTADSNGNRCILSRSQAKVFCDATVACDGVRDTTDHEWLAGYPNMVSLGKKPMVPNSLWAACVKAVQAYTFEGHGNCVDADGGDASLCATNETLGSLARGNLPASLSTTCSFFDELGYSGLDWNHLVALCDAEPNCRGITTSSSGRSRLHSEVNTTSGEDNGERCWRKPKADPACGVVISASGLSTDWNPAAIVADRMLTYPGERKDKLINVPEYLIGGVYVGPKVWPKAGTWTIHYEAPAMLYVGVMREVEDNGGVDLFLAGDGWKQENEPSFQWLDGSSSNNHALNLWSRTFLVGSNYTITTTGRMNGGVISAPCEAALPTVCRAGRKGNGGLCSCVHAAGWSFAPAWEPQAHCNKGSCVARIYDARCQASADPDFGDGSWCAKQKRTTKCNLYNLVQGSHAQCLGEEYNCYNQDQARNRCEELSGYLCSKDEIATQIGPTCRFMWTTSSSTDGFFISTGAYNCGIIGNLAPGMLYQRHYNHVGTGYFDAACCKARWVFAFDGCPRINGIIDSESRGIQDFHECAALCNGDCGGFEINGCHGDRLCYGACYTLRNTYDHVSNGKCITDGSQKFYMKDTWIVPILNETNTSTLIMTTTRTTGTTTTTNTTTSTLGTTTTTNTTTSTLATFASSPVSNTNTLVSSVIAPVGVSSTTNPIAGTSESATVSSTMPATSTDVASVACVSKSAGGNQHSIILKTDGSVHATGNNVQGQLGDGTNINNNFFVQVVASGVDAVAAGSYHSMILKTDGSVHGAGKNTVGQLGDGTNINKKSFVQVVALGVMAVAAGDRHSMIVKMDGTVHAAGENSEGQLGDGTNIDKNSFVQVVMGGVNAVAAGKYHSLIVMTDGSLLAAGNNSEGQLGDGTSMSKSSFVPVIASGVNAVAAGRWHSLILKTDGSLHSTGSNVQGQLGDGSNINKNSFVQVVASGVDAVAAGSYHSLILKTDGSLHAAGKNAKGQLGDGANIDKNSFVQVVATGVKAVVAAHLHSLILKTDGSLHTAGMNLDGQLGDGTSINKNAFVQTLSCQASTTISTTTTVTTDPLTITTNTKYSSESSSSTTSLTTMFTPVSMAYTTSEAIAFIVCPAGERGNGGRCNCTGAPGWNTAWTPPHCDEGACYSRIKDARCRGNATFTLGDGTWCFGEWRDTLCSQLVSSNSMPSTAFTTGSFTTAGIPMATTTDYAPVSSNEMTSTTELTSTAALERNMVRNISGNGTANEVVNIVATLADTVFEQLKEDYKNGVKLMKTVVNSSAGLIKVVAQVMSPSESDGGSFMIEAFPPTSVSALDAIRVEIPAEVIDELGPCILIATTLTTESKTSLPAPPSGTYESMIKVIGLTLQGLDGRVLEKFVMPVKINLGPSSSICHYLNEAKDPMEWTREGVIHTMVDGDVVCETDHFSFFGGIADGVGSVVECSNIEVFSEEGLRQIYEKPSWMSGPAGILLILFFFFQHVLLLRACRKDVYHRDIGNFHEDMWFTTTERSEARISLKQAVLYTLVGDEFVDGSIASLAAMHFNTRAAISYNSWLIPPDVNLILTYHTKTNFDVPESFDGVPIVTEVRRNCESYFDTYFVDSTFGQRARAMFMVVHPWSFLTQLSMRLSFVTRSFLFVMGQLNSVFVACLFFQSSGGATPVDAPDACASSEVPFMMTRAISIGLMSNFISLIVPIILYRCHHRRFHARKDGWTASAKQRMNRWIHGVDVCLVVFAFLWCNLIFMYISAFLASVHPSIQYEILGAQMCAWFWCWLFFPAILSLFYVWACQKAEKLDANLVNNTRLRYKNSNRNGNMLQYGRNSSKNLDEAMTNYQSAAAASRVSVKTSSSKLGRWSSFQTEVSTECESALSGSIERYESEADNTSSAFSNVRYSARSIAASDNSSIAHASDMVPSHSMGSSASVPNELAASLSFPDLQRYMDDRAWGRLAETYI